MGVLSGKVALVTGGGRGIGWGISRLFALEGARVVMMGRTPEILRSATETILAQGGRAVSMPGDVSRAEDVQRVVDTTVRQFGHLDILVCNAGVNPVTPLLEITEEEWNLTVRTNLTGSFLCIQRAARAMVQQGSGGRVVVIASVDGSMVVPGEAHYGASKAALLQLVRIAAIELVQHGIYVNGVAPGWVYTDLTKPELDQPERLRYWLDHVPAGRIGTIDEIAQAVLFLARDDIGHFTVGTILTVDGGHSLLLEGMGSSWSASE